MFQDFYRPRIKEEEKRILSDKGGKMNHPFFIGCGKNISHSETASLMDELAAAQAMEKLNQVRHVFLGRRGPLETSLDLLLKCLEPARCGRASIWELLHEHSEPWRGFFRDAVRDALLVHDPALAADKSKRRKRDAHLAAICRKAIAEQEIAPEERKEMAALLQSALLFCGGRRMDCALGGFVPEREAREREKERLWRLAGQLSREESDRDWDRF